MSSLYNIQKEYFEIFRGLEENGGELTKEMSELIHRNEEDFETKVENSVKMINYWQGGITAIDNEIARLTKLKNSKKKSCDYLKRNISESMHSRDVDKLDLDTYKLSFRKSSSVIVDDEDLIPRVFIKVKETRSVDKTSLKKELMSGEEIPGVFLEEKQNLQIR